MGSAGQAEAHFFGRVQGSGTGSCCMSSQSTRQLPHAPPRPPILGRAPYTQHAHSTTRTHPEKSQLAAGGVLAGGGMQGADASGGGEAGESSHVDDGEEEDDPVAAQVRIGQESAQQGGDVAGAYGGKDDRL